MALALCAVVAAGAAPSQEPGTPESDFEIEEVDQMLEKARKEIREFRELGGQEDDPTHPGWLWAQQLWRYRQDHPGTAAADRATTESVHFMLHAGMKKEAVERALAVPDDDGAWPQLINILFEAAGLEEDYSFFVDKADTIGLFESDLERWTALRFRVAQAWWVEGDFDKARAALTEVGAAAPSPEWTAQVEAARQELAHAESHTGERSGRQARDLWQRPGHLMDALAIGRGDRIADLGSGQGYFSFLLARRVGAEGKVYAVDIDEKSIEGLEARAAELDLDQIETVIGADDDPRLPEGKLDTILVVDTYHEMRGHEGVMKGMFGALAPGGRLAIVDIPGQVGKQREEYHERHRIPVEVVIEDAADAGFRLDSFDRGFARNPAGRRFYLVVFTKPTADDAG